MDALPNLRIVGAARAGLENVDVKAATERGIVVEHLMGRNAHAVSDFTIGMILAEARNIARAHHAIRQGVWRKQFVNSDFVPELGRRVLGLVGFGYIGRLIAKKLAGFEMKILVHDPYVSDEVIAAHGARKATLDEILAQSDFVSLHARLTDDNKGLIGERQLALMKPTAVLINTARAGLIQEDALYAALKCNKIAGAALDVFWTEPPPPDSRWLQLDNVTLTTHIAGTTADTLNNSPYLLVADINRLLTGKSPEFVVNPEALKHPKMKAFLHGQEQIHRLY
jgi:D-3-phosphoglycerate dehydrogenase